MTGILIESEVRTESLGAAHLVQTLGAANFGRQENSPTNIDTAPGLSFGSRGPTLSDAMEFLHREYDDLLQRLAE